jgi:predicted naringenin-chalcone synthase
VVSPVIAGFGAAFPPAFDQQEIWTEFFADYYAGHPVAAKVWQASGVDTRHGVCDPRVENVSQWGTAQRMQRYQLEAMPLGKDAVSAALANAGLSADAVGLFVVVSCTGYATPGLDILLARDLGMRADVRRLFIGHMGCYAAVPALAVAADHVRANGTAAVVLCAELTSLHVQPATDDVQQMVAHALFSDGVAAVVVAPDASGWELLDVAARTDVDASPLMTWDVTDLGFRMGLSPQVPDVLAKHVAPAMTDLLDPRGLAVGDVSGWAVHPGGPRIVDVVEEELALSAAAVEASRAVLRQHGNCSSATVLFVLDEMDRRRRAGVGEHAVAMAFGPGLTLYAALLRRA